MTELLIGLGILTLTVLLSPFIGHQIAKYWDWIDEKLGK